MNDMSQSYHWGVMRRAIGAIERRGDLSLEALAAEVGMSPAHFQRTFSKWVGVSPKRYQQYLRLGLARDLLRERFTTLETSEAVGLSGPSRLHDLFLSWEAMTPGDYARRGAGLTIRHGWFEGPFGEMLVAATDRGICGIGFVSEMGRAAALADLTGRWPEAEFRADEAALAAQVAGIMAGNQAKLHLIGGPFQIKVWEALLQIPSGHVSTYGAIARAVGNEKAVRAVGTAVGRNPVSWLIPCHRVLRASGELGGYHWGLPVKRALLAWESARADAR